MTPSAVALHSGRLLLTPQEPEAAPEPAALEALLRDGGLLGEPAPTAPGAVRAGGALFELIGFTGCAVQLERQSDAPDGLVLRIEGPWPAPVLRAGRNTRAPRCPGCGQALAAWRAACQDSATPNGAAPLLRCDACAQGAPACRWRWGRHGGCGRLFVALEPVFPGEAQPLPALSALLARAGYGPWRHLYVQD